MTTVLTEGDLARFHHALAVHFGLQFKEPHQLGEILAQRLEAGRQSTRSYLGILEGPSPPADELQALAQALTVSETYFFRNIEQFNAFMDHVLPERLACRPKGAPLTMLSAGCASGEEPYSLAMLIAGQMGLDDGMVDIKGVDINPAALARAARGRFSAWSLRETPPDMQARWFRKDQRDYLLDRRIRSAVRLEERNLVRTDPDLWAPEHYDVIFCRNVLMYFSFDAAQELINRMTRALLPGGYLFLGHAETLRGLSKDFCLHHSHNAFYYQKRQHDLKTAPAEPESTTWIDRVETSFERIQLLSKAVGTADRSDPAPAGRDDLGPALALLEKERFAEALVLLRDLPQENAAGQELRLLRAVLLVHGGKLGDARRACEEILANDPWSAGAHYLLAVCCESGGDSRAAADHDQVAAYLDPAFAMPRLHLGLLARRQGDLATARRELKLALELLAREDSSRILLFGAGFGKEALRSLCRAELAAAGFAA